VAFEGRGSRPVDHRSPPSQKAGTKVSMVNPASAHASRTAQGEVRGAAAVTGACRPPLILTSPPRWPHAVACQCDQPPSRKRYGQRYGEKADLPVPAAVILAVIPLGTTSKTGGDQADGTADLTSHNDTGPDPLDGR
jgi:hypothetical protein